MRKRLLVLLLVLVLVTGWSAVAVAQDPEIAAGKGTGSMVNATDGNTGNSASFSGSSSPVLSQYIDLGGTATITQYQVWYSVAGVTAFQIQFSTDPTFATWYSAPNLTSSGALVTASSAITGRYVRFAGFWNSGGGGSASFNVNEVKIFGTIATVPAVPTSLTATPHANSVDLAWTGDGKATSYKVYNASNALLATVTSPSYTVTGLSPSTGYMFQVSAVNAVGESAKASVSVTTLAPPDTTPPAKPTGLQASPTGTGATITWTANTEPDLYNYRVYVNGGFVGTSTTASYTLSGLNYSQSYTVGVSATDNAGNESSPAQITFTTLAPPPPPPDTTPPATPTGLTVGAVQEKSFLVSWDAVTATDLAGYKVYRDGVYLATVTSGESYILTGLVGSTSYSVTVTAFDNAGNESPQSAAAIATTQAPPPPPPPPPSSLQEVTAQMTGGEATIKRQALRVLTKAVWLIGVFLVAWWAFGILARWLNYADARKNWGEPEDWDDQHFWGKGGAWNDSTFDKPWHKWDV